MTTTLVKPHTAKPASPRSNGARRREQDRKAAEKRREQLAAYLASDVPLWTPKRSNGLTHIDIFCGAGGSSIGLANAGYRLLLGANHWQTAIDTHSANFRSSEHLCADVNNYDFRYLPRGADVGWFSPICTELSPAGGNTRVKRDENGYLDMVEELGHVSKKGQVRTRATFFDVLRATEVHRFKAVIVENVPDAVDWELFDVWLAGMDRLGYRWQLVSVNSAHVGGDGVPHAPQWRDRLYIVFVRKDIGRKPDVTPAPLAWCNTCAKTVKGVQTWAPSMAGRRHMVGRYRRIANSSYGQYWYTCPQRGCRSRVEPYVLPAIAALDMTDVGVRIGDLPRTPEKPEGLKPKTMARIRQGLSMYGDPFYMKNHNGFVEPHRMVKPVGGEPLGTMTTGRSHSLVTPFTVNSNHDDTRISPVGDVPLSARTTKIGDGLVVPPMLVPAGGTWADKPLHALAEPARTVLANEKGCEALVTPGAFLAMLRNNGGTWPVASHPMPTLTASGTHHALIVPYYSKGDPSTTADPLGTISTRDRYAMVGAGQLARMAELDAMDAFYRMLKPRESLRAQTFPDDYIVLGGSGEQTMQAGNAVSCNAAQWLGEAVAAVLLPHPA